MFGPLIRKFLHTHGAKQAADAALSSWAGHRFGGEMLVITVTKECAVVRGNNETNPALYRKLSAALADHADSLDLTPADRPNT